MKTPLKGMERILLHVIILVLVMSLLISCAPTQRVEESAITPELVSPTLRILTYNIHVGKGMDGRLNLERTARVTLSASPDIVALQEVDRFTERCGKRDELTILTIMTALKGVYGKTIDFQGGEYGIAVLSKCKMLSFQHALHPQFEDKERRGFLTVLAEKNGVEFAFINTHLGLDSEERRRQVNTLLDAADNIENPLIIAGDFNFKPQSPEWNMMNKEFMDAAHIVGNEQPTFPADTPDRRIDYVWVRRNNFMKPLRAKVIATEASDHRPLAVDITFTSGR